MVLEISLTKMCYGISEGRTDVNQEYPTTFSKRGINKEFALLETNTSLDEHISFGGNSSPSRRQTRSHRSSLPSKMAENTDTNTAVKHSD